MELKAGTYSAVAQSAKLGESPKKGTPFLCITFDVTTPEGVQKMDHWLWMTSKCMKNTKEAVAKCGFFGKFEDLLEYGFSGDTTVNLVLKESEYGVKVAFINSPNGEVKELSGDARLKLACKFDECAIDEEPAPPVDDDDCPF